MKNSRRKYILKNLIISVSSYVVMYAFNFIVQRAFVDNLSIQVLGLDALLKNIINLILLANLGADLAVTYSLYKPINNNDNNLIASILKYYKKIYYFLGLIVFIIGLAVLPFLSYFINSKDSISVNYYLAFFILLFTSMFQFFIGYRKIFLVASQKSYVNSFIFSLCTVVANLFQLLVLIKLKNYYIYLLIFMVRIFIENIIYNRLVKYKHPDIFKTTLILPDKYKKEIKTNIKAMFFHRVGLILSGMAITSIIISKLLGIKTLGMYSNYVVLIAAMDFVLNLAHNGTTASFGNLIINDEHRVENNYKVFLYLSTFIALFTSICFFFLSKPFVSVWLGKEYLLGSNIVLVMAITNFINAYRKSTVVIKNAYGIFHQDRFKCIISAVVSTIVSLLLAPTIGLLGIVISLLIGILIPTSIEPYVVYKYGFKKPLKSFVLLTIRYMVISVIIFILNYYLLGFINIKNNIYDFFAKFVIISIISLITYVLLTFKTDEFKMLIKELSKIIKRFKK